MKPFSWTCPFCNQPTTITPSDCHISSTALDIDNIHGRKNAYFRFVVCPNPDCKEFAFSVLLFDVDWTGAVWREGKMIREWNLIPPSRAKVFPSFIPKPILTDYIEACLIENLSPKASATLSRRCLQGMIRDFWRVKKARLIDEIEATKDKVDPLTWKAIDAVRKIGNIGAHMEKDINLIVEVEPNEASLLIGLIETLIKDWYITRHEREESLKTIVEIGKKKKIQKEKKNS